MKKSKQEMHSKKEHYMQLSPEGLAKTGGALGALTWVLGLFWHGGMGQPSMMMLMYGTPYLNPFMQTGLIVLLVAGGFIGGYLTAKIYNWAVK